MLRNLVLLTLLALLVPIGGYARDFSYTYEGQTLKYTVIDENAKTCRTKAGLIQGSSYSPGNYIAGSLVIPSVAYDGENKYTVVEIGSCGFSRASNLVSVSIPNTVTKIGEFAFYGCESLTSITLPPTLTSIGESAFHSCTSLASVTLPPTLTSIGEFAFCRCTSLASVTLPSSLTSIGESAFYGCKSLASVTLPSSLTSIGVLVFEGCSALAEVIVPNTIRCHGMSQFINATSESGVTDASLLISTEPYVKIVDSNGNPGSIKDAIEIDNSYNYSMVDTSEGIRVTLKNLHPQESVYYHILGSLFAVCTKNIDITLRQSEHYADLAVFEASYAHEEFVTDYYWYYRGNAEHIHQKRISIPYGSEPPRGFAIEGEGFANNKYLKEPTHPTPEFTECDAVATSLNKARLTAMCNLSTGAEAGIEWRRNDAPDNVKSNNAACPVVNGILMGELRGLKDDVYYKFRPFYDRNGQKFYGEWVGFFTGDAGVYFEPEVGTLPSYVSGNNAELEGYAYPGTDDVSSSGIEYRRTNTTANIGNARYAAGDWIRVSASSKTFFKIRIEDLDYDSEYEYRAYAQARSDTYYGNIEQFRTGANTSGVEDILIEDDNTAVKISLVNNPVTGNPKVIVTGSTTPVECLIYSVTGAYAWSGTIMADGTPQEIEASLAPGMYIITAAGREGAASARMIVR